MKTIREWLEELPEPYRTQALENTAEERKQVIKKDLDSALWCAFDWIWAKEGCRYWSNLHKKIENNESLDN